MRRDDDDDDDDDGEVSVDGSVAMTRTAASR